MIEARGLSKRYGAVIALDDLSFTVLPGTVTGFLGRNGAGKSTTMRMVVGLHRPTAGTVTVSGRAYRDLVAPLHEVGTLLDAAAVHPGMTARAHLRALAISNGISAGRVAEVLDMVGLSDVATRRAGTFSLGMRQRLGIATALLGDPPVVMLDEPLNGLDPDGVRWLRRLMRELADEGRTIFFSSHLMSEMALVADRLIVLHRHRVIADTTLDELLRQHSDDTVVARVPDRVERARLLDAFGGGPAEGPALDEDGAIGFRGVGVAEVGQRARDRGVALAGLTTRTRSLEEVFMAITAEPSGAPESGVGS